MIAELGHFALILAFAVAIFQMFVPMIGAAKGWSGWIDSARPAALAQFGLVGISFAALTIAFVTSDFSVALVYQNSHTAKPMLYKISGVWGNHEGSMLLWVLIVALFGAMAATFDANLPPKLRARVLSVQGSIGAAFLAFILFTSNPFLRMDSPPFDGRDLNPLLQDPGLAFHPPFLYLGYVGLSMAFSFAVAALIEGRAYYELGWGGFWFWDPVENASFMPWLIAAALLHSSIVVEKREVLKSWTILLAIMAFGFSLIGTFIVRSGVITSVHSFASDPKRGVFILAILAFFVGGALLLYTFRATSMQARGAFAPVSREGALVLNNILLAVSTFVVFIGTVWPLVAEMLWDRRLSVGAPFFEQAFTPFMVALAIVLPVGAILPWKRGKLKRALYPLRGALVFALAVMALVFAISTGHSALAVIGAGLGAWLVAGAAVDLWLRTGNSGLSRLRRLPRADWGKAVAHAGLGVTFIGISLLMAWQAEDIRVARIGETFSVAGYDITLQSVEERPGPNYNSIIAAMTVSRDGRQVALLHPEKRVYPVQAMPTTEAAIQSGLFRDLYLVIGDEQQGGGWAVRSYIKPFALWIWLGCGLMALGGCISLSDRRYRVAAGARQARVAPQPAE
ncbi:heme lyase CcmF/NrfE family subunit [Paracoccus sp. (in: a-proteobacteria)]|uniref:heme lyase CcmF/NrfE family subunit n=1 Tax=Paracoccus sp. TaxID=267 RepID=UPI0028A61A0E|nr:heme lyase CcmF/NrfE family subunit [Paracoccus sp. (in: a-proteobacteria)]